MKGLFYSWVSRGFGSNQDTQAVCERVGLRDTDELLATFSESGPNFRALKPKRKGAFWGFVLQSEEGRDYYVKESAPVTGDTRQNTQLMYHLGTKLGIKMPHFRYKQTTSDLWTISAGLSRDSTEKSYNYRDYSEAKVLNYLSAICRVRKYDGTSVDSITRFLLLSSLCTFSDLHHNNFGVVTSRRKGFLGAIKRKFALVDFFVKERTTVSGLPGKNSRWTLNSLKNFLLSQDPDRLSTRAPELYDLIFATPEDDLRRASHKFFDSFQGALTQSEKEVVAELGKPGEEFVLKLRQNFLKLQSWYQNLPAST